MRNSFSGVSVGLVLAAFLPVAASAATINIGIQDNTFNPSTITVMQGDTVRWTNNGQMQHTVSADNGSFDSPTLGPGQTFQWTFNQSGTFRYYCALHGSPGGNGMSATLNVSASGSQTQTYVPVATQTTSGNPTVDALRNQVMELLNRITTLQTSLGVTSVATPTTVPAGTVQCPLISRNLKRGMSGDDVTRLQRFLALDKSVYPEAQVTGYYGGLTEAAVQRFQCKNKIVCEGTPESTGYGVTGPRTASLLALQCPDVAGNVGGFIKVTPINGPAPLQVSIEATVNTTRSCGAATYEIDYGDNTPKTYVQVPANHCNELRQILNHTYSSQGTFSVTLRSGAQQTSATVTVGGGSVPVGGNDTISAAPSSGAAPLVVTFKGTVNAAGVCNPGSYTLDFGDNQSVNLSPSGCTPSAYTVTHQYSSGGNFIARLSRSSTNVASVNISVSGGTAQVDSINASPTSGASPLTVTFTGVVNAAASCNSTPYYLNFGDGQSVALTVTGCNATGYTVTHTYSAGGTFTAKLERGNPASTLTSLTITVSGGTSGTYGSYFAISPGESDVFAVTANFELPSSCTAYNLNWGDGTAAASQSQGTCSLGVVSKQLTHTYQSDGSYTITLKRGPQLGEVHTAGVTISE